MMEVYSACFRPLLNVVIQSSFFFSSSLAVTAQTQPAQAHLNTTPQQQQQQMYTAPQSFANYVYDPSTGYYYDSSTGLYYDANTQVI